MTNETKEKWLKLYGVANEIEELDPWEDFSERDPFCYIWKDKSKTVFFSFIFDSIGRAGVACYIGEENYMRARKRLTSGNPKNEPVFMLQNALMCVWDDRAGVSRKNYEIIKELGLKFRGRGAWLHFEHYEIGYEPEPLTVDEVVFLTEALENLYMMVKGIYECGIAPDFSKGDILLRWYEEKDKLYYTHPFEFDRRSIEPKERRVIFQENEHLQELRKRPSTNYSIELDWSYLNAVCGLDNRRVIPLVVIAADKKSGYVLNSEVLSPKNDKYKVIINILDDIFEEHGKPVEIIICDKEIEAIVSDFCKKAGIKLTEKKRLPAVKRARDAMEF